MINYLQVPGPWNDGIKRSCFKYCEYKCNIVKTEMGIYCGYVKIHRKNKLYKYLKNNKNFIEKNIDCHGGITFISVDNNNLKIGFDCAHHGDLIPTLLMVCGIITPYNTYKTAAFARLQVINIVHQLVKIGEKYED